MGLTEPHQETLPGPLEEGRMGGCEGGGRFVGGEDVCQEQAGYVLGLGPELGLGRERGSCLEMGVCWGRGASVCG